VYLKCTHLQNALTGLGTAVLMEDKTRWLCLTFTGQKLNLNFD